MEFFSKLDANEKLATYGAAATVVGGVAGYSYSGATYLAVLLAIGMLAIVFLPQLSPATKLPGSKGSLMVIAGGAAGILMLLSLLASLDNLFYRFGIRDILFLIAVAGGLLMAWAGWQVFQAEGGKFNIGATGSAPAAPTDQAAPAAPPAAPAAPAEQAAPVAPPAPTPPAAPAPTPPAAPEPAPPMPEADAGMGSDEDQIS